MYYYTGLKLLILDAGVIGQQGILTLVLGALSHLSYMYEQGSVIALFLNSIFFIGFRKIDYCSLSSLVNVFSSGMWHLLAKTYNSVMHSSKFDSYLKN